MCTGTHTLSCLSAHGACKTGFVLFLSVLSKVTIFWGFTQGCYYTRHCVKEIYIVSKQLGTVNVCDHSRIENQ